jgi:hypothetical protein
MGCALSLPGCQTDFGGLAVNGALDVIEGTDPVQRLAGDGGFGLFPDIVEITPPLGPSGRLLQ